MEEVEFINTQKEKLGEYSLTYHDRYEKDWFDQYYVAQNFRSVWYNALQKIISSKIAKDLVQKDFEQSARGMYDALIKGNSDSISMLEFTFF